jgi:hypothetical protein
MALRFESVKKAYKVFHELKKILPELEIPSWPEDMADWPESQRESPKLNLVYGFGKKSDSGWENLVFFTSKPSLRLLEKFEQLKSLLALPRVHRA